MLSIIKKTTLKIILGAVGLLIVIVPNKSFALGFGDMFGVPGIHTIGTERKQEDSLLHTIQTAINWVLGVLATITLFLVLYAGFLILTSGGDSKKYDSGINIIKNAAIGLAIIGLSRLIVSAIFWFINGSVTLQEE